MLGQLEKDGFEYIEFPLDMLPLIIGGEIKKDYVDFIRSLLGEFSFKYSAHIGRGVDLRDTERFELQKKVLLSSIKVSSILGMNPLVLHYEKQSRNQSVEERFLEAHIEAADYAAQSGITLCIENIQFERVDTVIEFVKMVSRPNFLMNFDTGHAFLASKYFHFNFLESLKRSLPVLGHVHLNDNMGIFEEEELRITDRHVYNSLSKEYRATFARGDIHIPPFWGKIPFTDVFRILKDYREIYICEYFSDEYLPFNRKIQEKVRNAIIKARH